jgi:hypothetical protein
MPGLVALPNAARALSACPLDRAAGASRQGGRAFLALSGSGGPRKTARNGAASLWKGSIRAPKWQLYT